MWDSRVELQIHYATCRSLAYQIGEFMANQHSFDLSTFAAYELNDMVAAMIEHLGETEDQWDPKDGPLLKDWYNIVHIKGVVSNTMSTIDQYNFPNLSPRYGKEHLSYLSRNFSFT